MSSSEISRNMIYNLFVIFVSGVNHISFIMSYWEYSGVDDDSDATIRISKDSPIVAQMRILRQHIDTVQSAGTTRSITECFYGALIGSTPFPLPTDIACKSGCSYCCNTWVYATAPEIFHLASSLRAEKQDALPAAIKASARVRLDLAVDTRLHHLSPCPILKDDICVAYKARPAACRTAYHSTQRHVSHHSCLQWT